MRNRKFQFASRGPQKGWFEGGWLKLQEIQDFWPTLEIENNRKKWPWKKKILTTTSLIFRSVAIFLFLKDHINSSIDFHLEGVVGFHVILGDDWGIQLQLSEYKNPKIVSCHLVLFLVNWHLHDWISRSSKAKKVSSRRRMRMMFAFKSAIKWTWPQRKEDKLPKIPSFCVEKSWKSMEKKAKITFMLACLPAYFYSCTFSQWHFRILDILGLKMNIFECSDFWIISFCTFIFWIYTQK